MQWTAISQCSQFQLVIGNWEETLLWTHVLKVYDFLRIYAHIADRPKTELAS